MLSLRTHSFLIKIPSVATRFLSFLERHCEKANDNNANKDNGPTINVPLRNEFKTYNLCTEPAACTNLNKKLALKLMTEMETIRQMERSLAELYLKKVVRGFCHLYVGQEACCVGIKSVMRPQDTAITSYRAHGWTWVMGTSLYSIMAEMCQKQTGCCRGKGGSMHTYAPNFFGGNGIVGSQIPVGTGQGLFHAYTCNKGVSIVCFGDGAANQGQLYESFNIACLWKLPVVFVCENNMFAMGTSTKRSSYSTELYTRGDYMPGLWANGNDVLSVRNATEFAINHVLTSGPILVELETYRYFGHSMSDPGTSYRTREEVQKMREKHDPVTLFKQLCIEENLITNEEYQQISDSIKKEIKEIIQKVEADKDTDPAELSKDIYALNLEGNIRNTVKRNLVHSSVGMRLVPPTAVKATPQSEIKELPKVKENEPGTTTGTAKKEEKKEVKGEAKKEEKKEEKKEAKKEAKKEEKVTSKETTPKNDKK